MLKQILKLKTALMFSLGLALLTPCVFAQGHQDKRDDRNAGAINRDSGNQHRTRHYYHNGMWNRNGWFGWGVPAPILSNGVLVASLPPGYTTVIVQGNTYYYGENTYFRPMSSGGFAVVTLN